MRNLSHNLHNGKYNNHSPTVSQQKSMPKNTHFQKFLHTEYGTKHDA